MREAVATDSNILQPDTYDLKAPIYNPQKLICVGLNYRDHCVEQGVKVPDEPVIFSKFNTAIIGPNSAIELPNIVKVKTTISWLDRRGGGKPPNHSNEVKSDGFRTSTAMAYSSLDCNLPLVVHSLYRSWTMRQSWHSLYQEVEETSRYGLLLLLLLFLQWGIIYYTSVHMHDTGCRCHVPCGRLHGGSRCHRSRLDEEKWQAVSAGEVI